jgi:hypothetical protein
MKIKITIFLNNFNKTFHHRLNRFNEIFTDSFLILITENQKKICENLVKSVQSVPKSEQFQRATSFINYEN